MKMYKIVIHLLFVPNMMMLRLGYFKIKFEDNEQCSSFTVFAPAEIVQ